MNKSIGQVINGARIAIPYALALAAPAVLAPKFARAYEAVWHELPVMTQGVIGYGLFMGTHLWLVVACVVGVFGGFVLLATHRHLAEKVERYRMALHLIGVLLALAVIGAFNLPRALTVVS